jgi:hypothetical protein
MGYRHRDFIRANHFPLTQLHLNSSLKQDPQFKQKVIRNLLKVKKMHDAEYTVTGLDSDVNRIIDAGKEVEEVMLKAVIVEHKGNTVRVGSGFNLEQRRYYHQNPNEILGKIDNQKHIGGLDVTIQRNFFGSQQQSFIKNIKYPKEFNKDGEYPAIFIRAPIIKEVYNNTKILTTYNKNIVAVQQSNILGTSFHPELSSDFSWHEYFIDLIKNNNI